MKRKGYPVAATFTRPSSLRTHRLKDTQPTHFFHVLSVAICQNLRDKFGSPLLIEVTRWRMQVAGEHGAPAPTASMHSHRGIASVCILCRIGFFPNSKSRVKQALAFFILSVDLGLLLIFSPAVYLYVFVYVDRGVRATLSD